MSDKSIFIDALNDVFESEMAEYINSIPVIEYPQYSRRYTNKIRKLIKRQRKPYFKLISTAGRRAACIIIAIIVFSASALSVKAIRKAVFDFITRTFSDHNVVTLESGTDMGYPDRIENEYHISALPAGFKQTSNNKTDSSIGIDYSNNDNYIFFSQYTKSMYNAYFDNEHADFVKISDDNGQEYIMITTEEDITFIWDNGEYIFEVSSNLDKDAIINVCKSTKSM